MNEVIVIDHQRVKAEYWSIHKAGCRDIKKTISETDGVDAGLTFPSKADAINYILDEDIIEMGYTEEDIKVYNCA